MTTIKSWWRHGQWPLTIAWKICISPLFTTLSPLEPTQDKRYFDGPASAGLWSGNTADIIALLFAYMPIIRREIYGYADLWKHTSQTNISLPSQFNSAEYILQLGNDGGLDYTAVIGEPPVPLRRVAYIFHRDSLNQHLAGGNELPTCVRDTPRCCRG